MITTRKILSNRAISASGSYSTAGIELAGYNSEFEPTEMSLQINVLSGSGTASVDVLLSNDGVNYTTEDGVPTLLTGVLLTGGPNSDGVYVVKMSNVISRYVKVRVTETGTINNIVVDAYWCVRGG